MRGNFHNIFNGFKISVIFCFLIFILNKKMYRSHIQYQHILRTLKPNAHENGLEKLFNKSEKIYFPFQVWDYNVVQIVAMYKRLVVSRPPAGMSLTKLFLGPGRVRSVTSRLGTGKWLTFFTVCSLQNAHCVLNQHV